MTERVMLRWQLKVRRKLAPANIFRAVTSRCKRTARRQVSEIRGQTGNLIEASLLGSRIRHRAQEAARVRIARLFKEFGGRRLFQNFSRVTPEGGIGPARGH